MFFIFLFLYLTFCDWIVYPQWGGSSSALAVWMRTGPVVWHLALCLLLGWILVGSSSLQGIKSSGRLVFHLSSIKSYLYSNRVEAATEQAFCIQFNIIMVRFRWCISQLLSHTSFFLSCWFVVWLWREQEMALSSTSVQSLISPNWLILRSVALTVHTHRNALISDSQCSLFLP